MRSIATSSSLLIERMREAALLARARASLAARAGLAGVLCLAFLAGCGSSGNGVASKSAGQILAATRVAAQSASSVHVVASSKVTGGGSVTLDASLANDRGHAKTSLLGISLEVIRSGETIYVKGNRAFAAQLGHVLGVGVPVNTWLKGPTTGALGQVGTFTDIAKEVPLILGGRGSVTKGATIKIGGQPAIEVKQEHKLYTGTIYVATTGKPYPLKLVKTGRETGQTTFTNWNDPVTVSPPANAIDISQLQHLKKGH